MTVQKISSISLFIALSVVGALIKIPSPVGSVALDLFPALVAVVLLGKKSGAVVGAFGHLASAFLVAMPLGLFHLMIAGEMALLVWLFGLLYDSNRFGAASVFVFLNGLVASIPFIYIMSLEFYIAITPSLLIASTLNVAIAWILLPRLQSHLKPGWVQPKW